MMARTRLMKQSIVHAARSAWQLPASRLFCVLGLAAATLAASPQDWVRANAEVRRLDPSVFTQLPAEIVTYLHERRCTIPQPFNADRARGAVSGHFISAAQLDWAVLCSVDDVSGILVFRSGGTSHVDELARRPDREDLQVIDGRQRIGYSRDISVATPKDIQRYGRHASITRLDHDGIEDAFLEKASTIHYWDRGRWLAVHGSN